MLQAVHNDATLEDHPSGGAMVLDDDPDVRASLVDALGDEGFEAVAFAVGDDALAWLDSHARETRVVLVDLMMPFMNGDAFLTAKEGRASMAQVPVIIMTGSGRELSDQVAQRHSVFRCLDKPLMLDSLVAALRACPGQRTVD
jgi:DNA-binding response OmpR family regulator